MIGTEPLVVRILVADDHTIFRRGLADILNHSPGMSVVAEAGNGADAVRLFREHRPDVGLIDLSMPTLGGVDAIRQIRREFPDARLIILTTYDTDEDIELGLKAGAQAYLLKDVTTEDLVTCIQDVMRGRKRVAPAVAEKLADRVSRVQLTGRELRILRLIAEGRANKEIADELGISDATVKAHVTNLFGKLHVTSRTEAIATAIRRGLVRVN